MDLGSAERFIGHLVTDATFDDRGTGREHRRPTPGHDAPVDHQGASGRAAGDRAEYSGQDRHIAHRLDRSDEVGAAVGQVGRAHFLGCADIGAGAVDQQDQGDAIFDGEILAESAETTLRALHGEDGRTALDGEVLAADRDRAAVDLAQSHHVRRGGEFDQLAILVFAQSGQRADFVERTRIEETVDTLAHGQASETVLSIDAVGRAAPIGQFRPPT